MQTIDRIEVLPEVKASGRARVYGFVMRHRRLAALVALLAGFFGGMGAASAAPDPTVAPGIVDTVTSSSSNLLPILITVGAAGIVVGAGVLALTKGWRLFRRSIG